MSFSNGLIIAGIVISFIVVTFLLLVFMPKPKSYFDANETCKELNIFTNIHYLEQVQQELLNIKDEEYINNVHMIYNGGEMTHDTKSIQNTYEILQTIPNVRCVFITQLNKKTDTDQRKGSADYANNTIRCVIPIKISATKKSGIWNNGETKLFVEGEPILYDDSHPNSMFNKHKRKKTYLLVVDIDRPSKYPIGISTITHNNLI